MWPQWIKFAKYIQLVTSLLPISGNVHLDLDYNNAPVQHMQAIQGQAEACS